MLSRQSYKEKPKKKDNSKRGPVVLGCMVVDFILFHMGQLHTTYHQFV